MKSFKAKPERSRVTLQSLFNYLASDCLGFAIEQRSATIVALLRAPRGRPRGLPLRPGAKGRPRCIGAVFSAEIGGLSPASMCAVSS
jgi:hypothetical protein